MIKPRKGLFLCLLISKIFFVYLIDNNHRNKNMKDIDNELFYAVENFDAAAVKSLLDQGANANVKNVDDDYPLYIALKQDNRNSNEIALELIKGMSNESVQDYDGYALRLTENIEIIDKLCEKGIDINKSDALMWANDPKTIQHLINKGADVNHDLTNKKGGFISNIRGGNLAIVKVFVENGVDIHGAGGVDWALASGKRQVADYLLEKTNGKVQNINECAFFSAGDGHVDLLKKFHEQGADINDDNNAIIFRAARDNQPEIIKYVLNNSEVPKDTQENALKKGCKHPEIVKSFLIEFKLKPSEQTIDFLESNASDEVNEILRKIEMNERLNQKHPPRQSTKKMTLRMKI